MILREVKFSGYVDGAEDKINEYTITLDNARQWWGQSLPTEQTEDGYDLLTEESVLTSLLMNLNLLEVELDKSPFEIFHDLAFLIDTMLGEEGRGELQFVETRSGQEGKLAPGYKLAPPIDSDDPFNF